MDARLVLIETSGNQRYIFATNRLRQNIGASALITQVGDQVLASVGGGGAQSAIGVTAEQRAARLLRVAPLESPGAEVEPILATSGRAIVLTRGERAQEVAERIIGDVTGWAIEAAPGLSVCGVIQPFDFDADPVHGVVSRAVEELRSVVAALPPPEARFLRIPIVEDCRSSGLPATGAWSPPNSSEPELESPVARSKRLTADGAYARMVDRLNVPVELPQTIDALERAVADLQWLGVVHADGNGIGAIFQNLHRCAGDNRAYLDTLRRFSAGLELATDRAFQAAVQKLPATNSIVPLVPVVLGGDDITVVCDGRYALDFTVAFLRSFEEETASRALPHVGDVIPRVAHDLIGASRLAASAGIAVVKPHFPFYSAYELAEQLLLQAKRAKQHAALPCSAFDFHALQSSSSAELSTIRGPAGGGRGGGTSKDGASRLWGGPYIVTEDSFADADDRGWLDARRYGGLRQAMDTLLKTDDDARPLLPRGLAHDLRESLFEGRAVADARVRLAVGRYGARGLSTLLVAGDGQTSLFRKELVHGDGERFMTIYLDALDAAELERLRA